MSMTILSLVLAATINATPQPQMVVTTEWLANPANQSEVLILDVTTVDEYNKGHIPGAVLLDVKRLMVRHNNIPDELPSVRNLEQLFLDAGVNANQRVILTSNHPLYATRAWFTLDYLGWGDHAAILDGGNAKWVAERRQTTTHHYGAKSTFFAAKVNPETVISKDQLKALMASSEPFVLLDARDPKHFLGHQKGAEVRHAGHIPQAECLPETSNLTMHKGVQTLKSPEALEQIYAALKITSPDQRIVVYCRTGVEASMNYFALRYLGFHPSLYDGSYVEWNKTEPVASAEK